MTLRPASHSRLSGRSSRRSSSSSLWCRLQRDLEPCVEISRERRKVNDKSEWPAFDLHSAAIRTREQLICDSK